MLKRFAYTRAWGEELGSFLFGVLHRIGSVVLGQFLPFPRKPAPVGVVGRQRSFSKWGSALQEIGAPQPDWGLLACRQLGDGPFS